MRTVEGRAAMPTWLRLGLARSVADVADLGARPTGPRFADTS
jgi:hypothetical protein